MHSTPLNFQPLLGEQLHGQLDGHFRQPVTVYPQLTRAIETELNGLNPT